MLKFKIEKPNTAKVGALMKAGYTKRQAEFLIKRGIDTPDKANHFFKFKVSELRSVNTMRDSEEFLSTLEKAIEDGKAITICGDYDADGIMATEIFLVGLDTYIKATGSSSRNVGWYINNRFVEGYGLSVKSIDSLLEKHPDTELIITCDNGIKSVDAIALAKSKGIDVIVSDHHGQSKGEPLPDCPVVCEKRLDERPDGEWFCGAELARRLVSELFIRKGIAKKYRTMLNSLLAYSGLATITDSVPMNAANRLIAKLGLYCINKKDNPFWQEIAAAADVTEIDEEVIGFKFGPIINAASRVTGFVDPVMDAIIASNNNNSAACNKAVLEMATINSKRQDMTAVDEEKALAMVERDKKENALFLLVDDERFEQGINGLTAARLVEAYHVPAIAMGPSDDPDIYKGSARSVPGFNIFEALNECRDLLVGFGGHPMAAGLACRKEDIGALRAALEQKAAEKGVKKNDYRRVDFIFDPADLDKKFISEMNALAPFGADYEKPVVGFKGTVYRRYVMKDKHVKYVVRGGARNNCYIQLIWWNSLEREQKLLPDMMDKEVRAIGYPKLNEFNGEVSVQFVANEVGEAG